jgi:hypothetical protein
MNKDVAMNSSRRKFAAILEALGVPPSARRSTLTPAAPACESLEGRQLLAGDMGGLGALALTGLNLGPADVSTMGGSGAWTGGAGGGAVMPGGAAMPGAVSMGTGTSSSAADTQLQTDLATVKTQLQTIQDQSTVTPEMTYKVTADINAIKAAETTPGNPGMLAFLAAATKDVDSSPGGPNLAQVSALQGVQDAVYENEGVSSTLITQLTSDQAAVVAATGITATEEAALAAANAAVTADQAALKPVASTTSTSTSLAGSTTPTSTPTAAPTPVSTVASAPIAVSAMGGQSELAAAGASVLLGSPAGGSMMSSAGDTGTLGLGIQTLPTPTSAAQATLQTDQTTLKTAMQTLQSEIQTIDATSNVTPAMEAVVSTDLAAVKAAASVAPNATDVATLKSDMATALTNSGGPTANQISQVMTDEATVYASEGVNTSLISKLQSAQGAITSASGITGAEEGALYDDEQVVAADQTKVETDIQALPATTTTTTTTAAGTTTTAPGSEMFGRRGEFGFPG